ncbi:MULTISPECIES: hypothetical protein [unclassified Arthrobacter]|uniref:hypothetical protein n=1 Tax=unclassified Arthrobacter TaxID=235627 RepID=UPI0021576683|nr:MULTISPECIES: hypothetical protein [unclassified Arthrobacter]
MSEPELDAVAEAEDDRETWDVPVPPGGWGTPWPQCVELARALPSTQWTLVGGLMVQLHAAAAGLPVSRPTADVDIVLHIETGAATTATVSAVLNGLGYTLEKSISHQTIPGIRRHAGAAADGELPDDRRRRRTGTHQHPECPRGIGLERRGLPRGLPGQGPAPR